MWNVLAVTIVTALVPLVFKELKEYLSKPKEVEEEKSSPTEPEK